MAFATRSTRVSAATPVKGALLAAILFTSACAPVAPLITPSPSATAVPSGGVLRVALPADITTLDPWAANDASTLAVLRQVYEPLVDLAPGSFQVVPKLADHWDVSSDGRTYIFTLRSGIRFHDGTLLDAAAVAANFDRGRSRSVLAAQITSVTATDALTVAFSLRAPYAPFLASLAAPSFGIVSPACLRQDPSWATAASRCAAGTGPFRLEPGAWRPGERITLTRAAGYWGRDGGGNTLPYLDGVTYLPMPDQGARAAAVHAGTQDVALDLDPAALATIRSDPNIAVMRRPSCDASFLGFAGATGPLATPDVRRAIAMAIDRAAIAQTAYAGDAKVATQLVPPGIAGYDTSVVEYAKYDTTAAKKLLADAGQGSGFAVDLWYPGDGSPSLPEPRRVADAIAADLAKVGITATLRSGDPARIRSETRTGTLLWIESRVASRADADDFLADVTSDPVVQALLDRARTEIDESKRTELYKQVTKLLQQQAARVPLFNASLPVVASRRVRGLVAQPVVPESLAAVWLGR